MALALNDRVQQTGTANTTVSFTLSGSVVGFQSFSVIGNGNTTYYAATDVSGNWEVGVGTYSTSGPTLTRTTILSSSNSGSAVTFSGTVNVFVTYPSEQSVNLDASGNVSPLGTIASGTWQGSTVGVAYGGTGVTSSSGANSVVLRDANENVVFNNFTSGFTAVTAAAGTTVLTVASTRTQVLVGSTTQTIQMPNATTLQIGQSFIFVNNSSGALTITNNAGATIDIVPSGGAVQIGATSIATNAGTWGIYSFLPGTYNFSIPFADFGNATISNAVWNGTTIAPGYGGTGLTTFVASNNALYSSGATTLTAGTLPVAAGGTGATTLTTNGVVYGNGTSPAGITAAGTTGQVLVATTSGAPSWGAVPTTAAVTSFQTSLSGLTPSTATTGVVTLAGTLGAANGGTGATTLTGYVKGNGTSAFTAASTVPASDLSGTVAIANGGTGQTTAADAFNALDPMTTTGDMIYASAANTAARLPVGTTGQVLTVAGGIPSWAAAAGSTTLTTTDFTATSGQTTFTVTYTPALLQGVYRNGIKLGLADYTATNGTSIVLAAGAVTGDLIQVQYFSSLATSTAVNSISFGSTGLTPSTATAGAVTVAGTLVVGNGGTGATTLTTNGILYGNGTSAVGVTAAGTTGQVLTATTGGAPSWAAAAGATITGTTTVGTYYVVGTTSTSGSLTTASISNTNAVSYNANTGALTAVSMVSSSDERLKSNIQTITNAVQTVESLRGVSYLRNDRPEIGVVAQEVEKVLPMLVHEDPEGYKSVAYGNMVGLLIEAVKELSAEVKALKAELNK